MKHSTTKRIILVFSAMASVMYLVYRSLYTMNLDGYYATVVSILLLVGEAHGIMLMLLYYYQIRDTAPSGVPAPSPGKTVDVFLATYNEDVPLLRGSIQSYLNFDYPCRIYVLDDGNREEVRELAETMGVNYITRDNNLHAKAGNINNALEQTDGEFVIIFDADHVARPNFISRTIGYFDDPEMAFVQTPHAFYNFFNFSSFYDLKNRYYWEEGNLFYKCIQLGKHNDNSVVFCGSSAIFRREALEDVGRIATETITEDMHTGLRLHAAGWKSAFCEERLISGQAAPDVTTFQSQRLRWGEGNMSIVKFDNPLTMPGLSLSQRVQYAGSMLGWTSGVPRLIIYATPILMMLTGISPVANVTATYFALLLLHLSLAWSALYATGRGCFSLIGNEFSGMACFWVQIQATWRAIKRKNTKFVVTKKRGRQSNKVLGAVLPQTILLIFSMLAFVIGIGRQLIGIPQSLETFLIGGFLTALHASVAVMYLRRALSPGEKRFSTRHENASIPAEITLVSSGPQNNKTVLGVCTDINETGMGVRTYEPLAVNDRVEIDLHYDGRVSRLRGMVCRSASKGLSHRLAGSEYKIGIRFEDLSEQDICQLWQLGVGKVVEEVYDRLTPNEDGELSAAEDSFQLPVSVVGQEVSETGHVNGHRSIGLCTVADKWKITLKESDVSDGDVEFWIDTPLGAVRGSGRSMSNEGGQTITFDEFEEQGRSILAETTNTETVSALFEHGQTKAPFRTTKRFLQTTSLACGLSLLITAGVIYSFHHSQMSLTMLEQGLVSSEETPAKLIELTSRFLNGEIRDELAASRLVDVLRDNNCPAESAEMAKWLCSQFPSNDGYFLRYAEASRADWTDEEYLQQCLDRIGNRTVSSVPLLLKTLRTAVAFDSTEAIFSTLERLRVDRRLSPEQRLECVGYAINAQQLDVASELLPTPGSLSDDKRLDAEILRIYALAAAGGWDAAEDGCLKLIDRFSAIDEVLLFAANGLYWGENYSEALAAYRRLPAERFTSQETLQMAECCLQSGDATGCIEICLTVMEPLGLRSSLLLESLKSSQNIPVSRQEQIRKLVKDTYRPGSGNERLLWALVDTYGESNPDFVLSELKAGVDRFPENTDLLLQSANLHYLADQFEDALALLEQADAVESATGWSTADRQMLKIRCTAAMEASADSEVLYAELVELSEQTGTVGSEHRLEAAGLALKKGYSEQALQLLQDTPVADKSEDYYRLKCGILAANMKWGELEAEVSSACELFPRDSEFRRLAGVARICTGRFEKGIENLRLSVEMDTDPERALETRCLIARSMIWNNDWRGGLKELTVVARIDPSATTKDDHRAVLYAASRLEKLTAEELWLGSQSYNHIVASETPLTVELINTASSFLLRQKVYDTTLELIELYPEFLDQDPWIQFNRGLALHGLENYQQAIDCFQDVILKVENEQPFVARVAVASTPYRGVRFDGIAQANERKTNLLVDANLAAARSSVGAQRPDLAVFYFERASKLRSFDTATTYEYAGVLLANRQFQEAREVLPARTPELSLQQRLLRLEILVAADDTVRTGEELDQLLERFSATALPPAALWRLAGISSSFEKHAAAANLYRQYLNTSAQNREEAQERYACQVALAGHTEVALDYFQRHISFETCELESLICLTSGLLNAKMQYTEEMNVCLKQIIDRLRVSPRSPEHSRLTENVVYCCVQSGAVKKGASLLRELNRDLNYTRRDLLLLYADLTAQLGDIAASNDALKRLTD